jgi:hypothetical protein
LLKYASESIHPVPGDHGRIWNVVGSGTMTMSGKPVNSSIPNPPPRTNAGGNTVFAESRL